MSETETNAGANTPEDVSLNVQDMVNVVKIIDVVSGRGAVNGDELSSVGRVRDRLVAFINANQPQPPADEPPVLGEETEGEEVIDEPSE
jgi:hypothetical protein